MPDLVVLVPALGRAHHISPLVESITEATPCDHRILFIATARDDAVIDAVTAAGCDLEIIAANTVGDYAKKINHGYRKSTEPYLFLGATDLRFHHGWYEAAIRHFADPSVGVVGTQDLCNSRVKAGTHSTHSLVSREYVDRFGTIDKPRRVLHEGYPHEYVDDEFVETARFRGAFRFEHASIVEHLHPLVGKAPSDAMYAKERLRMKAGAPIYRKRSRLWR